MSDLTNGRGCRSSDNRNHAPPHYFTKGGPITVAVEFRRNDQDRRPPSRVLTPKLMGDPDPDRLAKAEAIRASLAVPSERGKGVARRDGPNSVRVNKRVTRQRADEDARG